MILPMTKYAFLVFHKDYESFLGELQALGVLHVEERKKAKEVADLQTIITERSHIKQVARELRPFDTGDAGASADPISITTETEGVELLAQIERELATLAHLEEERLALQQEAEEVRPWGNFDSSLLTKLTDSGYALSFYTLPLAHFTEDFQKSYPVVSVAEAVGRNYFVALHRVGEELTIPGAEAATAPIRSIGEVEAALSAKEQEHDEAEARLRTQTPQYKQALEAYDLLLENKLTFGTVRLQADKLAEDHLLLLEGFVPTEKKETFEQAMQSSGYYYRQIEFDPETEKVPIELKNNPFTKCFEFITGLFSLPNYNEIDQTVFIAPFFMLFFGMCFGDAGYGLILFAVSTYFRMKSKSEDNSILGLGQWLGGGAFVVGMLMGGIFGIELPWAHNKDYLFNQDNLMTISVIVGIIQVLLGKAIGAYKTGKQKGWKHSLAGYAWVLLLTAIGLIYALPMAQITIPTPITYVLYGVAALSVLVAFFYNSPGKNPFINFGSGIWKTYETASGLLGDSLSYIRLFAIGLTGGILGSVFNQLAMSCVPSSGSGASIVSYVIGWILALIVLLFGHGINFGIAMIGSFVHPLRLTFVEYYKNSEFEGGGRPYTPFKRKQRN